MSVDVESLTEWLEAFAADVSDSREELTRLDSAIGDADHGTNLDRGMSAVLDKLADLAPDAPAALLKATGMTLVSTVGGASGPLYGTFFLRMASSVGDDEDLDAQAFGAALRAGLEGVIARGKAEEGDKTMVDALTPAVDAYEDTASGDADIAESLRSAVDAARGGRDATVEMEARKGRASYLGKRSIGHQDPGATSMTMLIEAAANTLS